MIFESLVHFQGEGGAKGFPESQDLADNRGGSVYSRIANASALYRGSKSPKSGKEGFISKNSHFPMCQKRAI